MPEATPPETAATGFDIVIPGTFGFDTLMFGAPSAALDAPPCVLIFDDTNAAPNCRVST